MREGWEIKKLDEIISFERGLTYAKGDEVAHSSVGVLRSNNVDLTTQSLNLDEIKYLREDFEVPEKKKVRKSSLLMCMSNGSKDHLGKVALIDEDLGYAFGGFMGLLTPDETKVVPKYLYYALASKSFKDYIHSLADGANINNLKYKDLAAYDILLLPLAEQQRIVDILDREFAKIDALKANAEKSLQAAKDLFQATLKKELEPKEGWEDLAIPEVSENLDSKRVPITKSVRENGQYPYYGASGIVDYVADYIFDEPLLLVSEDGANLLARSTPIAFSVEGKVWVNNHSHVLRFDDYKKQKFVEYWFAGNDISSLITGTAQPKFNQKALNSIKIAFPVKEQEMESILKRLDEMEEKSNALQENYHKTLTLCDDLKQSLLRKAFSGEL